MTCPTCGKKAEGWICAICGAVSDEHNPNHVHEGSDRYCTMKCTGCNKADVHCTCEKVAA